MGCKVAELYSLGSADPREQGTLRYTLELLLTGSLQSPASQKSITYLGLGFGSPRNRAQHSRTEHMTSQHITEHNTAQQGGYGLFVVMGAGAGAGGWGGGGQGFC